MLNHKTIKAIITITLLAMGFLFAGGKGDKEMVQQASIQEIDTTKLERYEQKVIIDAKWGSGPGEFGVIKEAAGIAPNRYTIDKNGNIYIPDRVNARVQIFDANGKYLREFQYTDTPYKLRWEPYDIAVDANENIYILFYIFVGTFPGQSVEVRKYDKLGSFVECYPIPLELLGPSDEEVAAGMPVEVITYNLTMKIVIENGDVHVEGWFRPKYLKKEKGETRRYTLVKKGQKLQKQSILGSMKVLSTEEEDVKFPHLGNYCCHFDSIGNHFYFVGREKIGEKNGWDIYQGVIYKYNKEGKLMAVVKYPFHKWDDVKQKHFDDETQNIYCLTNDDEGLKLLLYRRVK